MSDDRDYDDRIRARRSDGPARRPERDRPRRRDDDDFEPRPRGDGGTKTLFIVLGAVFILGFCLIAGVVVGMVFLVRTAVSKVQVAATQMQAQSNLQMIGLAIHNYHDANGKLPPVAMKTRDGKPGLSWRVAILPHLQNAGAFYRQFKLDEPWDHPDNLALANQMPYQYAPPNWTGGDKTHVRVFFGNRAMFDMSKERRFFDIKDGLSNTIMVVEAADPVLWIKPDELPFDPKRPLPALGLPGNDRFNALMGDGSTRMLRKSISPDKLKLAIDAEDGQFVDLDN